MKNLLFYSSIIIVSFFFGSMISWSYSYYPHLNYIQDKIKIEDILKYSNTSISKDNFACEGKVKYNVGSVVGSIIELNNLNKRNMLTFGCFENTCTIMVTNCMPWINQECGSRILKFNIDNKNKIISTSFNCIDMP